MKFKVNGYGKLRFNKTGAIRELDEYVAKFVKEGGVRWLGATVEAVPIPTWSGASRATFEKLARDLGTSVPIGPIRSRKDRTSLGRSTSAGSGYFRVQHSSYFIYTTQLRYLRYNEFNAAVAGPPPQPFSDNVRFTPYRFQDLGDKAWDKYARGIKIPDPFKKHLR